MIEAITTKVYDSKLQEVWRIIRVIVGYIPEPFYKAHAWISQKAYEIRRY